MTDPMDGIARLLNNPWYWFAQGAAMGAGFAILIIMGMIVFGSW